MNKIKISDFIMPIIWIAIVSIVSLRFNGTEFQEAMIWFVMIISFILIEMVFHLRVILRVLSEKNDD